MAAKLFKHLIIGVKKVPDQPVKDDPTTGKTTGSTPGPGGSVQELRSTSPAKANRASAAPGFVAYSSSSSWLGTDLGPGADGGRRHSDASTIRGRGMTRIPGRTRADPMSFRGGSTRIPPGSRRHDPCDAGRGRGAMRAKGPRTEGLSTELEGGGTPVRSVVLIKLYTNFNLI